MSIKARRGLLLVALMVVVSALVLSVGVSSPTEAQTASVPPPAPISGNVSVKATFLHADRAELAGVPDPPRVVDLSSAGYNPGDTLRISYNVPPFGFSYYGCQGPFEGAEGVRLLGVFSSSSELLAPSASARVPGAIDAGEDVSVGPTYPNNEPVDIPQDFRVTPPSGFLIKIPPSATHLFLGIPDAYYSDNCGTGANFVIETAPDTTAPSLTVPSDTIGVEATGSNGAVVDFANKVSASDAVDPNPSIDCTPASGTTFGLGTTTVSCTAKDASGNQSPPGSFDVKVQDTTAPAIDAHADVTEEAAGPDGATVHYTKPAAKDVVDGSVDVNCTPDSGSQFELGETTVTCSAQDGAGNEVTGSFIVTVQDTTAPSLTVPSDTIVVAATGPDGAKVYYDDPIANDAVDGSVDVNCEPPSGSTFPLGESVATCTATDDAGNSSQSTLKVKVVDTTAPTISDVPTDINETTTSSAGTVVNYANPTASDLVDGNNVAVNCEPPSGSTFPLGTTQVNCSATDAAGNKAEESFMVSVTYKEGSPCTIGEIEPPVNNVSSATDQGMSAYKYGSRGVIPAKFKAACNGDPIDTQAEADAHPMKLTLTKLGTTPDQDAVVENTVTGSANTGDLFRFDEAADHYIYNVGVKNLASGTYKLTISEANGGATHDEWFSIK